MATISCNMATKPLRVLVCPDTFKGTLSSHKVAAAIQKGLQEYICYSNEAEFDIVPMSDGGCGMLDCLLAVSNKIQDPHTAAFKEVIVNDVMGPLGIHMPITASSPSTIAPKGQDYHCITSRYVVNAAETIGVVEMAQASGLSIADKAMREAYVAQMGTSYQPHRDPRLTTSYGVGQLLLEASEYQSGGNIQTGVRGGLHELYIGLGGSATNDGGMGCIQALGADIYVKRDWKEGSTSVRGDLSIIDPSEVLLTTPCTGGDLAHITRIDCNTPKFASFCSRWQKRENSDIVSNVYSCDVNVDTTTEEQVQIFLDNFLLKRSSCSSLSLICDVTNPFTGPSGATAIYGPQKSGSILLCVAGDMPNYTQSLSQYSHHSVPDIIEELEEGMEHLRCVISDTVLEQAIGHTAAARWKGKRKERLWFDVNTISGSGAAGGLGGALIALVGTRGQCIHNNEELTHANQSMAGSLLATSCGADILQTSLFTNLTSRLQRADIIITGEGCFDSQTILYGKTVSNILQHIKLHQSENMESSQQKTFVVVCGLYRGEEYLRKREVLHVNDNIQLSPNQMRDLTFPNLGIKGYVFPLVHDPLHNSDNTETDVPPTVVSVLPGMNLEKAITETEKSLVQLAKVLIGPALFGNTNQN